MRLSTLGVRMDPYQDVKYPNPPIVEVVCEFRFVPGAPWDLAVPGLVYERVKGQFPHRRSLRTMESAATAEESGIRQEIRLADRMQILREDEKAFVQVGSDILAVNHLEPYPTWEQFVPLVREGYDAYLAVAQPKGLRRIGLRYINRIEIAAGTIDLAEYLNFRPFVGPGLPQAMCNLIMGIQSSYEGGRDTLRLQLVTEEPRVPERVVFILDLDYFLSRPESVALGDAFDWIESAHAQTQRAFEACLTDRLRGMFGFNEE